MIKFYYHQNRVVYFTNNGSKLPCSTQKPFELCSIVCHWEELPAKAFLNKKTLLQLEAWFNKNEWRILYYTTYAHVREKVNGIIALEITALAILLTINFYLLSRRSRIQSIIFMEESNNLRHMNSRLQNEINEREKAEKNLKVAEQSLAQNSNWRHLVKCQQLLVMN